jgi:hypothetical protein
VVAADIGGALGAGVGLKRLDAGVAASMVAAICWCMAMGSSP